MALLLEPRPVRLHLRSGLLRVEGRRLDPASSRALPSRGARLVTPPEWEGEGARVELSGLKLWIAPRGRLVLRRRAVRLESGVLALWGRPNGALQVDGLGRFGVHALEDEHVLIVARVARPKLRLASRLWVLGGRVSWPEGQASAGTALVASPTGPLPGFWDEIPGLPADLGGRGVVWPSPAAHGPWGRRPERLSRDDLDAAWFATVEAAIGRHRGRTRHRLQAVLLEAGSLELRSRALERLEPSDRLPLLSLTRRLRQDRDPKLRERARALCDSGEGLRPVSRRDAAADRAADAWLHALALERGRRRARAEERILRRLDRGDPSALFFAARVATHRLVDRVIAELRESGVSVAERSFLEAVFDRRAPGPASVPGAHEAARWRRLWRRLRATWRPHDAYGPLVDFRGPLRSN